MPPCEFAQVTVARKAATLGIVELGAEPFRSSMRPTVIGCLLLRTLGLAALAADDIGPSAIITLAAATTASDFRVDRTRS
jgi:hypothetical protein